VRGDRFEVVLLHAEPARSGLGRALMERARQEAIARGCRSLWLVTTNANTNAQGFYEHLGMTRVAIHAGAIAAARADKPGIPTHDEHGTPIRDEFEYAWDLGPISSDREG
jgi:GNAT superfamily N-acetyltransferase